MFLDQNFRMAEVGCPNSRQSALGFEFSLFVGSFSHLILRCRGETVAKCAEVSSHCTKCKGRVDPRREVEVCGVYKCNTTQHNSTRSTSKCRFRYKAKEIIVTLIASCRLLW